MNRLKLTFAIGTLALTAASAVLAQPAAPMTAPQGQDSAAAAPDRTAGQPSGDQAPSAAAAGVNASATAAPQGVEFIRQGNNILVTNGPIPDTRANRARFGEPLSLTGRRTKPAGN
jgi:hypothetical protein